MREITRRIAVLTGGLALVTGAMSSASVSAATSAPERSGTASGAAVTCYGSATSETFNMGTDEAEHSFGPYYTASPKVCGDINLKITKWGSANPLRVRICFYPAGGGKECTKYKSFVKSDVGKWRVLATDVIPGTKYRISMDYASHVFKGKLAD
ncbi:hypothetical protein ABZ622_41500 [Streptomyces sp. NPDC007164]|uniref:hypothetical protein n=1 Tax=Streptomyces sp. NPDC007164 TaxID=3156918 RepID=UPI0033ECE97A